MRAILALDGVRDLEEQRAVEFRQIVVRGQLAIVSISDKEHGLPIEFVTVQNRSEERAVVSGDWKGVQRAIAVSRHVLPDDAHQRFRRKAVGCLEALDVRGVETVARDIEPLVTEDALQRQLVMRPDRWRERDRRATTDAPVCEIDAIARKSGESDPRNAA